MNLILDPVEELEAKKVAELARAVMRTNRDMAKTVGAMIASRQLYAMAIHELQRQVELLPLEQRHELLQECLIQSAANQAGVQFNETTLLEGFTETVFPWMKATCEAHNKADEIAKKKQLEEYEEARRAVNIQLPFSLGLNETNELPRKQSLVLVGWKPVVDYVLDWLEDQLLTHESPAYCLVRLSDNAGTDMDLTHSPKHFSMASTSWAAACGSRNSFGYFFVDKIAVNIGYPPDVLICDNLKNTIVTVEGKSSTFQRNASTGHRRLRDWSHHIGCGLIAAIPLEENFVPDLSAVCWDELKHWSCLRAIWVKENPDNSDKYDVYLGQRTYLLTVDKLDLESSK